MEEKRPNGLPLGRQVPTVERYAPELLYPIARAEGRSRLGLAEPLPFYGVDLWHAYEMSWLDGSDMPVSRVGRFTIPAHSPCMVESKSLKLYLNSLNNHPFAVEAQAVATITADVGAVVGAPVELELFAPDAACLAGRTLPGDCLDGLQAGVPGGEPVAAMLRCESDQPVRRQCYSHLLRSLCPVTAQPDWATVWFSYTGRAIDRRSLLSYLLAYRRHQEFHEQCVERMFRDILLQCRPQSLDIQAFYTRRGGLDISPFRSTDPRSRPMPRLNRQ